jgi:hypothetical protein
LSNKFKNPYETDNFVRILDIHKPTAEENRKSEKTNIHRKNKVSREFSNKMGLGPDGFKRNSTNILMLKDQIISMLCTHFRA